MFINFQDRDLCINLNKVSNVGFIDSKFKVVFNFSHSIDIEKSSGEWGTIADYKYVQYATSEEYYEAKEMIIDSMKRSQNFLEPIHHAHYWVNKNEISYLTIDSRKNRLIFNLSTSITKETHKGITVINDFVFWSYEDKETFEQAHNSIIAQLA